MTKSVTRRDFLNGVSVAIAGASAIGPAQLFADASDPDGMIAAGYYPPTLTGLRGSHEGAFEVAHALAWRGETPSTYEDLATEYDLVVVGAGISGLAAALFYQQQYGQDKKILILENHDEFGGHARRNEFHTEAGMLLGPGGSLNLENYHLYSDTARGLIEELGFDLAGLRDKASPEFPFASLETQSVGIYINRDTFGEDKIVNGHWIGAWLGYGDYQALIDELPLPPTEREALVELVAGTRKLLTPLPTDNPERFLRGTSYQDFLTKYVGLDKATTALWNIFPSIYFGVGVDSVSIAEAISMGLPASSVLNEAMLAVLAEDNAHGHEATGDGGVVWMPDGNASLTRQMVKRLIPRIAAGESVEDLMTARFDYSQLDRADQKIQLRLNSTVVNAINDEGSVNVSYVTAGKAYRVRAKHCVMACYNGLIPHLCPELPDAQKEHLRYGVKVPLVVANVLLRNGRAFAKSGSSMYFCPGSHFSVVTNTPNTPVGAFNPKTDPDSPMLVYMLRGMSAENNGSQSARDLYRIARHQLYTTSFADFESTIRNQLTGMFGAAGFDADRDIEAITVNRWPHGYAYEYMELFEPDWPEGGAPYELGRKPFGRITIANSDSEAYAYVNAAIDAAWRAVNELPA